jgi:hypothetical protein
MAKRFPTNPRHPERICWGCDLYCPAKALACGNGADRTMHPMELFGEDWNSFEGQLEKPVAGDAPVFAGEPAPTGTAPGPVEGLDQNAVLTVNDRLRGSP